LSIPFGVIFRDILKKYFSFTVDITIRCMVYYIVMNGVQEKLGQLQNKGWTLAALADELAITPNAVEKWKSGDRQPNNTKAVLALLDQLAKRKRIPKKRRYNEISKNILREGLNEKI